MTTTFADLQERYGEFYSPRFAVELENERSDETGEFTDRDGVVSDLSVDTTLDGADQFSFVLNYKYDPEFKGGTFVGLEWDLFDPGTRVDISIGYEETNRTLRMLSGRIKSVKTDFPSGGVPTVSVSGYDLLHDLTEGTTSDSWNDKTDSDVVELVLRRGKYGLTPLTTETGVERRKIIQNDQSDYQFLKELADRNGFEFRTIGRALYFGPPTDDPPVDLTLAYGESLNSFSPERNSAGQVAEVEVRHWDAEQGTEIVGTAKADDAEEGENGQSSSKRVLQVAVRDEREAKTVAEAVLMQIREGLVTGNGETVGIPELLPGTTLSLQGLTEQFTGEYYVTRATHRLGSSGYGTSFSVSESL